MGSNLLGVIWGRGQIVGFKLNLPFDIAFDLVVSTWFNKRSILFLLAEHG